MAINRIRRWYEHNRERCSFDEGDLCQKILANTIGFDLNPLAVMASRANYLIAIRDLIGHADRVEIPVYLCDSIMTPSEYGGLFSGGLGKARELKTAPTTFIIPTEIATSRDNVAKYADQLEHGVRNGDSPEEFLQRCRDEGLAINEHALHVDLFGQLVKLDKANKNGVWARIIKNAFAPLFIGKVDYVAGNPPWINWENLPADYRDVTKPLWTKYGLFTLKGHAARLGGGKKDIAMLFVYLCLDAYLAESGLLGFVITQTLFKTREAGDGFRRFGFPRRKETVHILPLNVIDMTELHPFEGATNRTATFLCKTSSTPTKWPVKYETWSPKDGAKFTEGSDYQDVIASVARRQMAAIPMLPDLKNSAWLTAPTAAHPGLKKVRGTTQIKAHAGVCTWMNGVFWLKTVTPIQAGRVHIQNWHDVGKIKVESVDTVIEDDLVYPLLRGRDVHRWTSKPSTHILLTQDPKTRTGISQSKMKKLRRTHEYLLEFEDRLKKRPGYLKYFDATKDPFWTIYNVGEYSVSPYRVLFKELTDFFQCAVVNPSAKPAIADIKLRFIDCHSPEEAHFLCGLLNSAPAVLFLYSTATWVQTADYQASDISRIALPHFAPSNKLHARISRCSQQCHRIALHDDHAKLEQLDRDLDHATAELLGITGKELNAIQSALADFGFSHVYESDGDSDESD